MAVQKISESKNYRLQKRRYYKEDIKLIIESLIEYKLYVPKFRLGNYELECLEDLDNIKNEEYFNSFEVIAYENEEKYKYRDEIVKVILGGDWLVNKDYIWIEKSSNIQLKSLATLLSQQLKKKFRKVYRFYLFWFSLILIHIMFLKLISENVEYFKSYFPIIVVAIIIYYSNTVNRTIIYNSSINKSFFKKNKENIGINLVFTVLGAILGFVIAQLTK